MSAFDDMSDEGDNIPMDAPRFCGCGCPEDEHQQGSGRCLHCAPGDCDGFEYDEDGTIDALVSMRELPEPPG